MDGHLSRARWLRHTGSCMSQAVIDLYTRALETAALLALPVIAVIGVIGVIVGLAQTITGIQDQNLSFGPKIAVVMLLAVINGPFALSLLGDLLRASIQALPHLVR